MLSFKVFLVLFILLQGQDQPFSDQMEVNSVKECHQQAGKLLNQPLPRNVVQYQVSCVLVRDGEPA